MIILVLAMALFVACVFLSSVMIAHDKLIIFIFLFVPGIILLFLGTIIGKKTKKLLMGASIGLIIWAVLVILAISFILYITAKYGP